MPWLRRKTTIKTYRRKNRRMKYGLRTGKTFQRRVKRAILKTAETKFLQQGRENIQLYHDVGGTTGPTTNQSSIIFNPWANIAMGTASNNRIGNKIIPSMLVARLWMANKNDRPNLLYRVIVARLPKNYGGIIMSGGNLDIFRADDVGTNGNTLCSMIDNEKGVRAYYDRVHRNEIGYSDASDAGGGMKECHIFKKLKIRRKGSRPITYESTGGIVNNPVAIYVIPYDSYGTLQTDNVASCAITLRMYYKDV